jgi:hypothetical protein
MDDVGLSPDQLEQTTSGRAIVTIIIASAKKDGLKPAGNFNSEAPLDATRRQGRGPVVQEMYCIPDLPPLLR